MHTVDPTCNSQLAKDGWYTQVESNTVKPAMSDHLYITSLSSTVRDIFHCTVETGFLPPLMDEKRGKQTILVEKSKTQKIKLIIFAWISLLIREFRYYANYLPYKMNYITMKKVANTIETVSFLPLMEGQKNWFRLYTCNWMELTSKLIDNLLSRERIQSQQQQVRARGARSFLNESQEHK